MSTNGTKPQTDAPLITPTIEPPAIVQEALGGLRGASSPPPSAATVDSPPPSNKPKRGGGGKTVSINSMHLNAYKMGAFFLGSLTLGAVTWWFGYLPHYSFGLLAVSAILKAERDRRILKTKQIDPSVAIAWVVSGAGLVIYLGILPIAFYIAVIAGACGAIWAANDISGRDGNGIIESYGVLALSTAVVLGVHYFFNR